MIELRRIDYKVDNLSDSSILTVIIPIRSMKNRDISNRLTFALSDDSLDRSKIDFLVVDDGSDKKDSEKFVSICKKNKMSYIYLDTKNKPFSIARARNVGAMHARSEYIMFLDVDLYPNNNFYKDILNEIKIQNLKSFANDFIMIGVIYLTEQASQEFSNIDHSIRKNFIMQKLLEDDVEWIEKFSTGTSVNIYNKFSYLSHGGNDEDFEEWGYDDLEFNLRMIRKARKFPFPENVSLDYKNFRTINEYKGWKSVYRLFGDITFKKGIYLTHIWHEIDIKSNYMKGKEKNRKLFEKKIEEYKKFNKEPDPLPSLLLGKTLLFSKTNPFIYNKNILPFLGIIEYAQEDMFDADSLLSYIKNKNIDRVLMFNPYGSEERLELYRALKKAKIPVLVAERGALRDSVFYDWNGFNAESISYDKKFWDKKLTSEQIGMVDNYITEETKVDISLEKQNNMIGADQLRKDLNLSLDQKILFVPLQRPSDSVIKYFCGPIGTYANFIMLVQEVANQLSDEYVVVVKKHPLEDEAAELENVIYTNANIKDLLELSDYVMLINSGVGLLAMLWNKPVLYCGDVFYNDDRINKQVLSVEEVLKTIAGDFQANKDVVYKFLYFLIEEFYSFGKFTTKEIPWEDGGRMTVTTDIDFYHIRNISDVKLDFYIGSEIRIKRDSILFDRYNSVQKVVTKTVHVSSSKQKIGTPKEGDKNKKIKKLKENPKRFFSESKYSSLRLIGKVLS
jgi:predicted glycosyltransferase involved in capsule biosynthesis